MSGKSNNTNNLLEQAIADGRNRNYASAVKKLEKLLSATDDLPEALLYLGRAHHELGNFEDSVIAFRLFITKFPKSGAGYFYLGRTYIAMQKFTRASNCFYESIKIKPDFAPALAYMGYSQMRSGYTSKSVDWLRRAVESEPDNSRIFTMYINAILMYSLKEFRNGNFQAASNGFLFIQNAGFDSITTNLYAGISLKEQGRYADACAQIESASQAAPDDNLIKNILAELYVYNSRIDDAVELLGGYMNEQQVIEFLEGIDDLETSLAVSYWNKQDYGSAMHFAVASLKKKKSARMHLLAGECLKNMDRLDDSFNHFERAEKFEKNTVEPLYGKATVLWLKKDFSGMMKLLDRIEKRNTGDRIAEYYRVLCSVELELPFSDWRESLKKMIGNEEDAWLYNALGRGELSEGKSKSAASAFRKAVKLAPDTKKFWSGLFDSFEDDEASLAAGLKKYLERFGNDNIKRREYAELLSRSSKYGHAADQYKILVSESAADRGLLKKYADCCRKAGRFSDAVLLYRQILSGDPYNEYYLKLLLYCMRKAGKDSETMPLLRNAVKAFKNPSIELMLVYGVTLYRNGKDEEALAVFQNCIYRGYKDWRIYRNMGIIYRRKGIKEWAEMYMKKAEELKKIKKN